MKKAAVKERKQLTADPEMLLTERQTAATLQLTERALQSYRYKGGGPPYIRISRRCVRYRQSDLRQWIAARVRTSTSDPGPKEERGDV